MPEFKIELSAIEAKTGAQFLNLPKLSGKLFLFSKAYIAIFWLAFLLVHSLCQLEQFIHFFGQVKPNFPRSFISQ